MKTEDLIIECRRMGDPKSDDARLILLALAAEEMESSSYQLNADGDALCEVMEALIAVVTPFARIASHIPESWSGDRVLGIEGIEIGCRDIEGARVAPTVSDWRGLAEIVGEMTAIVGEIRGQAG